MDSSLKIKLFLNSKPPTPQRQSQSHESVSLLALDSPSGLSTDSQVDSRVHVRTKNIYMTLFFVLSRSALDPSIIPVYPEVQSPPEGEAQQV